MMGLKTALLMLLVLTALQEVCTTNFTLTLLHDEAQKMGAVCLDGSPAGYYMRPGVGGGAHKWILHLMGGGWCGSRSNCYERSLTKFGSTKPWPKSLELNGFLSDSPEVNPDFHDWNVVFLVYCDGASFTGDNAKPDVYNGTTLYYRGYRILHAVINHLNKERGLTSATDVILTGCSAGGLAVYLHADHVQTLVPSTAKYRAFADAGYFLDMVNINGTNDFVTNLIELMAYQNIDEAIIPECKADHSDANMWNCMFAPYVYDYIKTPLFVLNSMYDTAQLNSIYGLPCLPGNCTAEEMKDFYHFKDVFDMQMEPVLSREGSGYYFDSCLTHCQTMDDHQWSTYIAQRHPMRESFADWYYQRPSSKGATQVKDCDWPCNHSCP